MGEAVNKQVVKPFDHGPLTLEAWSQGFMVGALIIMCGITLSNMRRGNLLHKLILIEVSGCSSKSLAAPSSAADRITSTALACHP